MFRLHCRLRPIPFDLGTKHLPNCRVMKGPDWIGLKEEAAFYGDVGEYEGCSDASVTGARCGIRKWSLRTRGPIMTRAGGTRLVGGCDTDYGN
jgi:hypothetical protein